MTRSGSRVFLSAWALAYGACTGAACAGEPPPDPADTLDTITVTASRSGASLRALGGEEIDRLRIERSLPWSAIDLLRDVAGVNAFEKGGAGGGSYLSIRGGEPNYTLVLLDGAKVNDPGNSQGGAFDLAQLDPSALQSIEVHRGALSAVHGADALAGVVHLRLRRPAEGERLRTVTLRADSEGGDGISATLGAGDARGGALLSTGRSDSGSLTGVSTRSRRYALARASRDLGALQVSGLLLHADSERAGFPEDSGGERLAANRELERGDGRLQLAGLELSGSTDAGLRPRLNVSWSRQVADASTPAIFPGVLDPVPAIVAATDFRRAEAVGDVGFALRGATVVLGGGFLDERGSGRGHIDFGFPIPADFDIDRRMHSVFGELAAGGERAGITLGVRRDAPSSNDAHWTGRLSGHVRLAPDGPALYASAANGFKLPSLYALAYPLIANPGLRPERSRMFELGLRNDGAVRYRLAVFSARYRDLIDFDPALFTNVNRSRVASRGVEGELSLPLSPRLALSTQATWMDSDAGEGVVLRSRPRLSGRVALDWTPANDWRLWAALRRSSSFHDSSIPTGMVQVDGFTTFEAGGDWRASERLRLTATLGNLFGRGYEVSLGTPMARNLARVALTLAF
ncbi:MAG TPA: TonB-dependent receptor [Luteimonas sp.]|nr:TonB-dependent receptor [Luteimonas sp.]HRP71656.1 TonB-dependent receptor [Luteimonas sp.]